MRRLCCCGFALVVWCAPGFAVAAEPDTEKELASLREKLRQTELQLAAEKENNKALQEQLRKTEADCAKALDALTTRAKDEIKAREEVLRKLQEQLAVEKDKVLQEKVRADGLALQLETSKADAARRRKDVEEIRKALADEIANSQKLINDRTEALRARNKAELEARIANDARQRLLQQIEDLSRELARIDAQRGRENPKDRNPPTKPVKGRVAAVDEKSGLMKINIGSDAGLEKGHTLELFRIGKNPGDSRYLGTVRVTDVGPNEAIVQPVGRLEAPAKADDTVADRIQP
jgi:hypothetical protein